MYFHEDQLIEVVGISLTLQSQLQPMAVEQLRKVLQMLVKLYNLISQTDAREFHIHIDDSAAAYQPRTRSIVLCA